MKSFTLLLIAVLSSLAHGFISQAQSSSPITSKLSTDNTSKNSPYVNEISMSTVVAPPEEKTKKGLGGGKSGFFGGSEEQNVNPGEISKRNDAPLEYLEDEWSTRNPDDPFHILLLDTTFTKSERVTVKYVAGCLEYVLGMPPDEATELTEMAAINGLSCLGTWQREECLKLGRQLQIRDLVVRVVPYCEGGMRGWQMKNANADAGFDTGILGGSGFD